MHWRERRWNADGTEHEPADWRDRGNDDGIPPIEPEPYLRWPERAVLTILVALALYLLTFGWAFGQETFPGNPPVHDHSKMSPARAKFYETWMRPDNRTMSCCNNEDCDEADAYYKDGAWYAKRFGIDDDFTRIPDEKVEHERDNPDGAAHLCMRGHFPSGTVYCFMPKEGS